MEQPILIQRALQQHHATAQPDITSADQLALSVLSPDIDHVMQRTIPAWKNEAISTNNTNHHNQLSRMDHSDDYRLADILQRNENDQQNMFLRCLGTIQLYLTAL